jgi:hypothetical protein
VVVVSFFSFYDRSYKNVCPLLEMPYAQSTTSRYFLLLLQPSPWQKQKEKKNSRSQRAVLDEADQQREGPTHRLLERRKIRNNNVGIRG